MSVMQDEINDLKTKNDQLSIENQNLDNRYIEFVKNDKAYKP